ncbi:MAG: hypothetical protein EBT95_05910 [Verrucomicrobia bacterium]|nr:hypothetical protein [Verrucomicrobiota bacterium]
MRGKRERMAVGVWTESSRPLQLAELAELAETTVEAVRQYCEMGLLGEEGRRGSFGEGTLFLVRRIESRSWSRNSAACGRRWGDE